MAKILIVYYSVSGHTQQIAEAIAAKCGAHIEVIRAVRKHTGIFGYWRAARESVKKMLAAIKPVEKNPEDYDLVVIGTPVWVGKMSSPIRRYLQEHEHQFKRAAFFCTQGGTGGDRVLQEMADLCNKIPTANLIVSAKDFKSDGFQNKISVFVRLFMPPA